MISGTIVVTPTHRDQFKATVIMGSVTGVDYGRTIESATRKAVQAWTLARRNPTRAKD